MADSMQFTKAQVDAARAAEEANKSSEAALGSQLSIAQKLAETMKELVPPGLASAFGKMSSALKAAGIDLEKIKATLISTFNKVVELTKAFLVTLKDFGEAVLYIVATPVRWLYNAVKGVVNAVISVIKGVFNFLLELPIIKQVKNFLVNVFKVVAPAVGQLLSSVFNIGKALFSLPSMITTTLLNAADKLFEAFKAIAQAFEDVRKQLGDPASGLNKLTRDATRNMSGLSQSRGLYTYFTDIGDAAKFVAGVFNDLGTSAELVGNQIAAMGINFVEFYRGMALSSEEVKGFAVEAITSGRELEDVLFETANMSLQMAESFGFTGKHVGRDMARMTKEVSKFGTMTVREMGEAAIYVRGLGLEVESLGKIVDKFLNFETAVESTARLAQAFGANLDTLKLMKAANKGGAGAIEELRRGMFAAGRDAEKMNLAELRLLSNAVGLTEQEAKLAFSMKNRGLSMEEIRKKSGKAAKQQLSQTEVMNKLADASERIIRSLPMSGSLFERFAQGFQEGIFRSNDVINTLLTMRQVSEAVYYAGMRVGQIFVEAFPGVKELLEYLRRVFDPKIYKEKMNDIVETFRTFFTALSNPKTAATAFKDFANNLIKNFSEIPGWLGPKASATGKSSAWKFLTAIKDTVVGATAFLGQALTSLLQKIPDWLNMQGATKLGLDALVAADSAMADALRNLEELVSPIIDGFKKLFNDPTLRAAFADAAYSLVIFLWDEAIQPAMSFIFDKVLVKLKEKMTEVKDTVYNKTKEALTEADYQIRLAVINFLPSIVEMITSASITLAIWVGKVILFFATLPIMLPYYLGVALAKSFELAYNFGFMLGEAIANFDLMKIKNAVSNAIGVIMSTLGSLLEKIKEFFKSDKMQFYIVNPIKRALLSAFSGTLVDQVVQFLGIGSIEEEIKKLDAVQDQLGNKQKEALDKAYGKTEEKAKAETGIVIPAPLEAVLAPDVAGNLAASMTKSLPGAPPISISVTLVADDIAKALVETGIVQGVAPKQ